MRIDLFIKMFASFVFLLVFASCAEDSVEDGSAGGGGRYSLTLRLAATVSPIPETKAVVAPARVGSEAAAAGFSYELLSSDTDTASTIATKAPSMLKNVYALLFTSAGAFNGCASLGTITAGSDIDITFTDVVTPTASNCRLVIVANDKDATNAYSSSGGTGGFASFSGTYAAFQALTITSGVSADADVPYAGSATFNLPQSETTTISLYRTLAKITLNNTFGITSGPSRSTIILNNAGARRFATPGSDSYDGTGTTQTTAFVATTSGSNANSNVWYVGENIRPTVSGVSSSADRNSSKAPVNACYIRIGSGTQSIAANTNPTVGQEYIVSGSCSFTYDIYLGKGSDLSDFSLRRHMNYTIASSVSGTLASQEDLSASDGRVTLTKTGGEGAGLCIGMFGGASGYTTGSGSAPTITGSYTKNLLLQPNISGTTAADNISRQWSATTTQLQPDTRKYWDPTYTLNNIDKTSGLAYDYCYNLTLGGVAKGMWYLPTQAQVIVMWAVWKGLQENSVFANYRAFNANNYWSSTENYAANAWCVNFSTGFMRSTYKTNNYLVRCVRDF